MLFTGDDAASLVKTRRYPRGPHRWKPKQNSLRQPLESEGYARNGPPTILSGTLASNSVWHSTHDINWFPNWANPGRALK